MKYLLDTHVLLWWFADDVNLTDKHKHIIMQAEHEIYVSSASIWEISIKRTLGKLTIPTGYLSVIQSSDFQSLLISPSHAELAGRLPLHHKDPFDRMLIAQASIEKMTILTVDKYFAQYDVDLC